MKAAAARLAAKCLSVGGVSNGRHQQDLFIKNRKPDTQKTSQCNGVGIWNVSTGLFRLYAVSLHGRCVVPAWIDVVFCNGFSEADIFLVPAHW